MELRYGAGAAAVAVFLYVAAAVVMPAQPDFDAPATEVAAYYADEPTRIRIGAALLAASAPFFVWFLATVASLTRSEAPRAGRAGAVAFGCGAVWLALFMTDVTTLAVGALRPENMLSSPEIAATLRDVEWLLMGMATFLVCGLFVALAALVLRDGLLWPRWFGWLAATSALVYGLRVGTLFTTDGAFAADGVLGLYVPVVFFAGSLFTGSLVLALRLRTV